jgi:hypothetical protein
MLGIAMLSRGGIMFGGIVYCDHIAR